jgi:hypothetical protein
MCCNVQPRLDWIESGEEQERDRYAQGLSRHAWGLVLHSGVSIGLTDGHDQPTRAFRNTAEPAGRLLCLLCWLIF